MGFDLNRHWQEPSPWAHPTLYATKNLLMGMDANEVTYEYDPSPPPHFLNSTFLAPPSMHILSYLCAACKEKVLNQQVAFISEETLCCVD